MKRILFVLFLFATTASSQPLRFFTYYPIWHLRDYLGTAWYGLPPGRMNWTGITDVVHFYGNQNIDSTTSPYWGPVTNSAWAIAHTADSIEALYGGRGNPECGAPCWTNWVDSLTNEAHRHGIKVYEDIHQVGDLMGWNYVTADSARMDTFAVSVTQWCVRWDFDGVQLDLENYGSVEKKLRSVGDLRRGIRILYRRLKAVDKTIVCAAPASNPDWYFPEDSCITYYPIQFYIFADPWDPSISHNATWHLSPLYRGSGLPAGSNYGGINDGRMYDNGWAIQSWLDEGYSASKLVVGLNVYGHMYEGVDTLRQSAPYAQYTMYKEILAATSRGGTVTWDTTAKESWIGGTATANISGGRYHVTVIDSGQPFFITYKSEQALAADVAWIQAQGLGGIMLYDLTMDYDASLAEGQKNPLTSYVANLLVGGVTPDIIVIGTVPDFGSVEVGGSSSSSTFQVAGTDLGANITITAPTHFEVSTDGVTFSSSVQLAPTDSTVDTTTIYVRFSPGSGGVLSGNVSCASFGASTENVAVSGTGTVGGLTYRKRFSARGKHYIP